MIFYHPQLVGVFFFLNNSLGNKWFNFKVLFLNVCTIIPLLTWFLMRYLKPMCSNFIMLWPIGGCLVYNSTNLPNLFHNVLNMTWTTSFFNCKYPSMCVHTFSRPMGIHLLRCAHGNERTKTHNEVVTFLLSLHHMLISMWGENNYMCFLKTRSTIFVNESTLCTPKMEFAP